MINISYENDLKRVLNGEALIMKLKQRVIIFLTELMEIKNIPIEVDILAEECFPEIVEIIGKELLESIQNWDRYHEDERSELHGD